MSFLKEIPYTIASYETYETDSLDELRKVASAHVDLPEGFQYDPDYLYLWIRIISSGQYYGPNKNGDYFPTEELEAFYQTFNEAHVFKNHENKLIEKAIGKIFLVRWDSVMKCVEIFKGIDKKIAPEIARGYLKGYMSDVSMGCKVPFTICSVCGNKARKANEFCRHIKNHRMEYLGNGERVFEINYEPKFHDSSVVLTGAERVAKALYIMDEPIEVGNTIVRSFRKAANTTTLCEPEMNKVASYTESHLHPLLQLASVEKVASDNYFLQKSAELEKEVTGKLLNIVSCPKEYKTEASQQLIQIIKFLTEKRMDEQTLKDIAKHLSSIAEIESLSVTKVFTTFISVSEMLGIELFPTELHTLLCELTNAKLESKLTLSDSEESEVYPSDFAKGIKFTQSLLDKLPEFDEPSELVKAYDEVPFELDGFTANPAAFFEMMKGSKDLNEAAPTKVIRIIKKTLMPFQPLRSAHSEFLLPRLSLVLGGHKSIIGNSDVAKDVQILKAPKSIGDVLANLTYGNYSKMRSNIKNSVLVKIAEGEEGLFEKTAKENNTKKVPFKGVKRRHIALAALPAAFGASLFQKSRREHGRNLSDVENFIADRPDVISGGVILGGKPLSRAVVNTIAKGGTAVKNVGDKTVEGVKNGFKKLTSEEYVALVKIADSLEHGNYNAFSDEVIEKFAKEHQLNGEYVAALKLATLFDIGGLDKEASSLSKQFHIGQFEKAAFLHYIEQEVANELEKAANDFTGYMLMETMLDSKTPFTASLPGRVIDAMVMKKISEIGQPKPPKEPKVGEVK